MASDQNNPKGPGHSSSGFAVFSFWFGLIFGIFGFFGIFSGGQSIPEAILGWIIIGPAPFIYGVRHMGKRGTAKPSTVPNVKESNVLKLAMQRRGILTASIVSAELGLSIEESRKVLESFVINGVALAEPGENGGIYYNFVELTTNNRI